MRNSSFVIAILALAGATLVVGNALAADDYVMLGKDKLWNAPRPDKPDLSVQYITRSPHYPGLKPDYVKIDDPVHGQGETGPVKILNDGAQRWPQAGEEVTFTVLVRNVGTQPIDSFDWHWMFDGQDIRGQSGRHSSILQPDETFEFVLKRPWQAGKHFIAFQVDRDRLIDEISEENNWVIDRTDALSFAFTVEESVREHFKTLRNGLGSYDWADWAQFQVRQMNKEFRDSIYPSCPDGVIERVRLDKVYVVPDGWGHAGGMHTPGVRLPVNLEDPEFYNANEVPQDELEVFNNVNGGVDGVWGFTIDLLKKTEDKQGKDFYGFMHRWVTGSEWPLHHELGHQLGRADHYLIWSAEDDNPIAPGVGYQPPEDYREDMMHSGNYAHDNAIGKHEQPWDSTYRFYSEHTAASLNRDKGVRRGLFGEYFFDIPMKNRYTFLTPDKQPVGNAKVELFVGRGRGYTGCGMNEKPNVTGQTDAAGIYQLDRSPWDHVFIWGNNGITMFRVTPEGGQPMLGFVPLGHYNLEYWRGNAWVGNYTVVLQEIE